MVELNKLSSAEFGKFQDFIYKMSGIRIPDTKRTLLSNRIRRRLKAGDFSDFQSYFNHLTSINGRSELTGFLDAITTNETSFFRTEKHFDWFRSDFIGEMSIQARRAERPRELRIWSAACSTGDEAATVACCIAADLSNSQQWSIQILGTDIGVGAVEQARSAVFGERAMRLVPADLRKRFFIQAKDSLTWQAKPALTKLTSFQRHNLMDSFRQKQFDLVFLKNVLIYFDTNSKAKVMTNILASIAPGGLLVAGASEGVSDMLKGCQRIESWLYRKPIR
jgi:chemotaxis protein methyltransferase CheR